MMKNKYITIEELETAKQNARDAFARMQTFTYGAATAAADAGHKASSWRAVAEYAIRAAESREAWDVAQSNVSNLLSRLNDEQTN